MTMMRYPFDFYSNVFVLFFTVIGSLNLFLDDYDEVLVSKHGLIMDSINHPDLGHQWAQTREFWTL